jgi:antitoxin (DNA-binding transcriptional repressor) of toxin-antitoxin stability system
MKTITASEARTHLYRLLRDAENGETVRIMRNGRVIARIEPILPEPVEIDTQRVEKAREAMSELRKRIGTMSVEEIISARDEGRR